LWSHNKEPRVETQGVTIAYEVTKNSGPGGSRIPVQTDSTYVQRLTCLVLKTGCGLMSPLSVILDS